MIAQVDRGDHSFRGVMQALRLTCASPCLGSGYGQSSRQLLCCVA
jgi:hypothetical protein